MHTTTWHVEVFLSEHDDETHARAVFHGSALTHPEGVGTAHRSPRDPNVPEIGGEVAAARALHALAHELLSIAGEDIAEREHHDVHLSMPAP